jgi:hypothetical protein
MAYPRDDRDVPAITREMFIDKPGQDELYKIPQPDPEFSLQPGDPIPEGMTFPSTRPEDLRKYITPIGDLRSKAFDAEAYDLTRFITKTPVRTPFPIGRDFNDSPEVTSILDSLAAAYEKENLLLDRGWTPNNPLPRDFENIDPDMVRLFLNRELGGRPPNTYSVVGGQVVADESAIPGKIITPDEQERRQRRSTIQFSGWPSGTSLLFELMDKTPQQREMLFKDRRIGAPTTATMEWEASQVFPHITNDKTKREIVQLTEQLKESGLSSSEARFLAYKGSDLPWGTKGLIEEVVDPLNIALIGLGPLAKLGKPAITWAAKKGGRWVLETSKIGERVVPEIVQPRIPKTVKRVIPKVVRPSATEKSANEAIVKSVASPKVVKYEGPAISSSNEALAKMGQRWDEVEQAALALSDIERKGWKSISLKVQEALLDKTILAQQVSSYARKYWKAKFNRDLPPALDAGLQFALMPGRPVGPALRTTEAITRMAGALGTKFPTYNGKNPVDYFLLLRHQLDVLKMHPSRKFSGIGSKKEVDRAFLDFQRDLGPKQMKKVETAAGHIRDLHDEYLTMMVDSGLVESKLASELRKLYPWYNRITYVRDDVDAVIKGTRPTSVGEKGAKRLAPFGASKDALQARPLSVLASNIAYLDSLIVRNNAAKALIKNMILSPEWRGQVRKVSSIFKKPLGERKGTISYMHNGKRRTYEVPKEAQRLANVLGPVSSWAPEGWIRMIQLPYRAARVGVNPVFMSAQFLFDTATVAITQGTYPHKVAIALAKNLRMMFKGLDPDYSRMMKAGGDMTGYWGRGSEALAKDIEKLGQIAIYDNASFARYFSPKNWYRTINEAGHMIEMSPRRAVFEKWIERGEPDEVAALLSRRSTVDFDQFGTAMRFFKDMYMFINPAVQGMLVPSRALANPKTRAMALKGIGGYMRAHLIAYAWNRQFPEYWDVDPKIRHGTFMFMLPSKEYDSSGNKVAHYIALLPRLMEFSLISAPIIYALSKLDGKIFEQEGMDPDHPLFIKGMPEKDRVEMPSEDVDVFFKALLKEQNPLSSIVGGGWPVPTALGESLVQAYFGRQGHDPYRNKPIVPDHLIHEDDRKQFDAQTSLVARRVGDWFNFSPMRLDFMLREGLFYEAILLADATIRSIEGEDPELAEIMAKLEDLEENYNPDYARIEKKKYMASLSADMREKVRFEERKPKQSIPLPAPFHLIGSLVDRFYKVRGGALWRVGTRMAERKTKLSGEQTQEVSQLLAIELDELFTAQQVIDKKLSDLEQKGIDDVDYSPEIWVEDRRILGKQYQMYIMNLSGKYPKAAQLQDPEVQKEWFESLYTLNGKIPDRRTRAQVILAEFNSIQPLKYDGSNAGERTAMDRFDWGTFYRTRDEFIEGIPAADLKLFNEERMARMTETEKLYEKDLEVMRDYYNLGDILLDNNPEMLEAYRGYIRDKNLLGKDQAEQNAKSNDRLWKYVQPGSGVFATTRASMRQNNRELDALLRYWGKTQSYMHPQNIQIYKMAEERHTVRLETNKFIAEEARKEARSK